MEKNRMSCDGGGDTVESPIAANHVRGGSNQDLWGEASQEVASNLSKSVVSIVLSDGNTVLFACSGIAIEHQGNDTRFLTAANLTTTFNDKTNDHDNLKVEVCHEGNIVPGVLENCDLEFGIAVVNATAFLGVQVVHLNHLMEFMCYSKVVALGRDVSGKLMFTSGMLTPAASGSEDSEDLMLSTCKISEAWVGGPLFDIEENFIGMNLFFAKERTLFLPTSIIFECLLHFRMSLRRSKFLAQFENLKASHVRKVLPKRGGVDNPRTSKKSKNNITDDDLARISNKNNGTDDLTNTCNKNKKTCNVVGKTTDSSISDVLNEDPFSNLDSMGYRKLVIGVPSDVLNEDPFSNLDNMGYPKLVDVPSDCLFLVNTFEATFAHTYGCGGVWHKLSETVTSYISQNVVSLASFYGEKRIFACSGSFIEWNGCATILTSASLVSHFVGDKKIAENLRIEVLLPNKERRGGILQHYNLHYNVALVNVKDFTAPHPANIQPHRSNHSSELVAIGRSFKSGTLMAASGQHCQHTEMPDTLDCKLLKYSTCRITKAGIGGPLVDYDGKFIGMNFCGMDLIHKNLYDNRTWTPFLSSDVIHDVLAYFKSKLTVAEVGLDGYASGALDWVIDGDDSSVFPSSWPVPEAKYYPREGCKPKRAKKPNPNHVRKCPLLRISLDEQQRQIAFGAPPL